MNGVYWLFGLGMLLWVFAIGVFILTLVSERDLVAAFFFAMLFFLGGLLCQAPALVMPVKNIKTETYAPINVIKTNYTTIVVYQINDRVCSSELKEANFWASTNIMIQKTVGGNIYGTVVDGNYKVICK